MVTRQHGEERATSWSHPEEGAEANAPAVADKGFVDLGAPMTLTDSQREILAMLEERPSAFAAEEAAVERGRGFGMDVAFASLGALAIVTGIGMLFFFAALGSILLVTGAILCAVAFEHVALAEVNADELDVEQASRAAVRQSKPIL